MSSSHDHGHAHHHQEQSVLVSPAHAQHTDMPVDGAEDSDSSIAWAALRRVATIAPVVLALWLLVFWAHSTP